MIVCICIDHLYVYTASTYWLNVILSHFHYYVKYLRYCMHLSIEISRLFKYKTNIY